MKVLVVGSGGREHALAWKIARSEKVKKVYCAPGNGGTASLATNIALDPADIKGLVNFAEKEKIDLTVVGPELPLTLGLVDDGLRPGVGEDPQPGFPEEIEFGVHQVATKGRVYEDIIHAVILKPIQGASRLR